LNVSCEKITAAFKIKKKKQDEAERGQKIYLKSSSLLNGRVFFLSFFFVLKKKSRSRDSPSVSARSEISVLRAVGESE
jgi:hypothetical protein